VPSVGMPELIIILVLGMVIFGPKKLPEMGKSIGNGLKEFKKATSDLTDSAKEVMEPFKEVTAPINELKESVQADFNPLATKGTKPTA